MNVPGIKPSWRRRLKPNKAESHPNPEQRQAWWRGVAKGRQRTARQYREKVKR